MTIRTFLSPLLVAGLAMAMAAPAQAGLTLTVSDGSTSQEIIAPPSPVFGTGTIGGVNFFYSLGANEGFTTQITLSAGIVSSSSAGSLTFTLLGNGLGTTTSGFTLPAGLSTFTTSLTGTAGSTSPTNTSIFDDSASPPVTLNAPNLDNVSQLINVTPPFTLSTSFSLNFDALGTDQPGPSATSIATVTAVPEPSGIVAGLMGLPCAAGVLAMARRRLLGGLVPTVA